MKVNLLLAVAVVALGYATCRNLQNKSATTAVEPAPAAEPAPEGHAFRHAGKVYDNVVQPDSARSLQLTEPPRMVRVPLERLPPPTASRKAYLGTGWWHVNMAHQPVDTTVYRHFKDRYLKFHDDQTFEVLYQNQVVDRGQWNWDEAKNELYLACSNPYYNNTWKVQDKGFVMIWLGNTDVNVTGIQVRVVGTKKDPFGQ